MLPTFFIDRPIFATVLSVLVTLAGGLAVGTLPISQFPQVTPPTIQVDCGYPGASANVVAQTIASPLEQQVNGVEDMLYMSSQCTSDGTYTLSVTFKAGTNLNLAQVRVQNRVNLALPNLPDVVRATGVTTRKRSPELLMTFSLNSPTGKYDQLYLSNYAVLRLKEELQRVPGISDVTIFGQRDYALRIWADPTKLAARDLTAADIVFALREQNQAVAAGQLGQPPAGPDQPYQFTLSTVGRLVEVEEFEQVIIKRGSDTQVVKIKDVARVELGAKNQDVSNRFDTKPTVGLAIFLLPDANALEVADTLKELMAERSKDFPEGVFYEVGYDTSPFIRESIKEVFKSLRDAIILVALVVLLFLQSWRAAVIPLAAVPVAIVGTFAAMAAAGFTINNLTLFGLVLAVGIVVDDAIVVVEAAQHQIELGYEPQEAAIRAMKEVAGPVVAVGVVLGAVFVPCAFLTGIIGAFFRQFALTIAVSTLISTFNSLTLSPALCAVLLKGKNKQPPTPGLWTRLMNVLFFPFALFNRAFSFSGRVYVRAVGLALRVPVLVLAGYVGLVAAGAWGYQKLPTGFIPQQDKGYLIASIQLPDASSAARTQEVLQKIGRIALDTEGVAHVNGVAGNSFVLSAYGSNFGSMFIILDGFDKRRSKDLYGEQILNKLRGKFAAAVPEAQTSVFPAPAVSGLGRAGGFRIMIEDRGDVGLKTLQGQTDNLIEKANQQPQLVALFTVFKTNSPQVYIDVSRAACLAHGVELADVYAVLQSSTGSRYVNDFNRFGRTWQVTVSAEPKFRDQVADIRRLQVRNRRGQMVPVGSVADVRETSGPLVISRYNMYPAAAVNGAVAAGVSSGDATAVLEQLAEQELPERMGFEWTELTFIENDAKRAEFRLPGVVTIRGNTTVLVFGLSVAFVFLILAALYESWAFPLAVILVVPVCVVGCLAGVYLAGQDVNIFTQVGFVVLIGLACKNAILIVEFARVARANGADLRTAVLDACRLRFRPIMMTSVAFILGVAPLVYARGAGAEMRQALGVAVLGGMIGVTIFGVILTPVFFYVVDRLTHAADRLGWLRRAGATALDVLTLKPVRRLAGRVRAAVGRLRPPGRASGT